MTTLAEPVVLFRASLAEEYELEECKKHFKVIEQRGEVSPRDLVIPRYSALPYYQELERDVQLLGGQLINSHHQHSYVADLKHWYYDLQDYTPKTWFQFHQIPKEGPFVLKGQTNSKKGLWKTHMFAEDKRAAGDVYSRLLSDSLISMQNIYVREYVELRSFGTDIVGMPITEEYRFFVLDGQILSGAFYWSEHYDYLTEEKNVDIDVNAVPVEFLQEIIALVSPNIRFFVVDVARTAKGEWIVIELNDGQMSGLSMNDPEVLYANMLSYLAM